MDDHDRADSRYSPLSGWHGLSAFFATVLSCYLGLWFLHLGGRAISPMWPAAGVSLGLFVRYDLRAAPWVILGHVSIWAFLHPSGPAWPVLLVPLTYPLEAWLVSLAHRRTDRIMATKRSAMWPVAWNYLGAPIFCALPTALISTLTFTASGRFSEGAVGTTFFLIMMAHVHGLMAFGGLSIHVLQCGFNLADIKKAWNGVLAGVSALVVMGLAFAGVFDPFISPSSSIFLPFPLLVMAAVCLPPAPVSLLVALWCVLSTTLVCFGLGPFVVDASAGQPVNPAEIALYNMVMSSVAYLVSVGSSHLLRQLNLNQIALSAAGIELWEWDVKRGFSWVQENPACDHLREVTSAWHHEEILGKLAGAPFGQVVAFDTWRSRIPGGAPFQPEKPPGLTLESAGRILQRGLGDRPTKAIGLLQDISALQRAEDALVALGYQKAKLRSLQAKLTPHFLFNSLNVIHALVHTDPKSADEAITSLANLLRYNLRTTENMLIVLSEELARIRELLHLARLRFGDRILTRIRVPPDLLGTKVPPMLLLNLVENAITHGIGSLEEGGMITVTARAAAGQIRISIRNSGTLPENAVRGVGTQDALQRLEMLFAGRARFSLSQMNQTTVSADVELPLSQPVPA
jgi:hypothetical protein